MKILLINPSGGYPHEYPPLGLLYIASVLRDDGHEVAFFDEGAIHRKGHQLFEFAEQFKPEACGVAVYTTNVVRTFQTISDIKQSFPECIMFAGGPHATVLPDRTMQECPDIEYLVCGEGELTTKELIRAKAEGRDVAEVDGLYIRDGLGNIKETGKREWIKDLDTIPFPAYELIEDFQYRFDSLRVGSKVATLMTSRGCPYECAFCAAKAVWRKSFRRRSPENVAQEISWLVSKYGYDELYFMDDLFTVNKAWLETFYSLKNDLGIDAPWKCLGRVDLLSSADYEKLAQSGCYVIQFGVESGHNEILRDIKKNITTFQVKRAFNEARAAGLNTYGFFIVGHRLEKYETVLKTINFARSIGPDFVSFFCLVPFPGTELYGYLPEGERYDWARIMYSAWGRDLPPVKLTAMDSSDLLKFEWQAHIRIYSSLSYLIKNIVFSRARRKLRWLKCKRFVMHLFSGIYNRLRGRWIFSRFSDIDLIEYNETDAFGSIWRDWSRKKDYQNDIDQHLRERKALHGILRKHISSGHSSKILEIGCGTAIDSHHLSKLLDDAEFWATDLSPEAVSVASKIGEYMGSRVNVLADDASSMQFEDGKFDVVFSQGLLEHFSDPMPVMKEQARVLKSGGYLVVDVPQKFNPYTIYKHRRLREGVWQYGWETEYSYGELKKLGRSLGLDAVDVGSHGYGYYEDYGFGFLPLAIRRLERKGVFVVKPLARLLDAFEQTMGHYFMQNITVVFKKT